MKMQVMTPPSVKHRGSIEIMGLMLQTIRSGSSKTKIMYDACLSYDQMKDYLQILEDKELIRYDEVPGLYFLKPNGLRYIRAYEEIREMLLYGATTSMLPERSGQLQEKYNF